MLSRVPKNALRSAVRSGFQVRSASGIKLLNEKAKAEEDYYFSKQDGMIVLRIDSRISSQRN